MDRLSALARFALALLLVVAGLRLVHRLVPDPSAQLRVATFGEARAAAGFVPWLPAYHPLALGGAPEAMVVRRERGRPRTLVLDWRGERRLRLEERGAAAGEALPEGAPLDAPGAGGVWWPEGDERVAVVLAGGLRLELRTDLPLGELRRMVRTLHPSVDR